jgi:hypothetical protein
LYNGKEVQTVKLDGVVVWQRYVPVPAGSKQVTTSFTVPARVTVVKIVGYSGEQQREYTAYVKVTPGKTYKVSCGDQYDVSLNDNGDEDIWWQDYMISIGKFQMGDIWGGNYSVIDDKVTISWSEEINKHATNGSAD